MKRSALIGLTVGMFCLFCFGGTSMARKGPDPSKAPAAAPPGLSAQAKIPAKADLVVDSISIARTAVEADVHKVRVNFTIKNNGGSTATSLTAAGRARGCGGCSKALVEWTVDPARGFNRLCEVGVLPLGHAASQSLSCDDQVQIGGFKKYRVTADHLNWVAESNEGNNVNAAGYVAH